MYYYMTEYSFDSDRPVQGPFSSYEECWNAMEKDAENELRIDTKKMSMKAPSKNLLTRGPLSSPTSSRASMTMSPFGPSSMCR